MEKILVEINYLDFEFTNIEEAIEFARNAKRAYKSDRNDKPSVKVFVDFEEEEEVND